MITLDRPLILVLVYLINVLKVNCSISQYWKLKVNEHDLLLEKVDNEGMSFGGIMKVKVKVES